MQMKTYGTSTRMIRSDYLLTAWLALLLICVPAIARGAITQWPVSAGGNGHYYEMITTPFIVPSSVPFWWQARIDAEKLSYQCLPGHLVTITSAEESDWLVKKRNGCIKCFFGLDRRLSGPNKPYIFRTEQGLAVG